MIYTFIKQNKKAIKYGFLWMSIIFTSIVLITLIIEFVNNQKPDLTTYSVVFLIAALGFPVFILTIGFVRWYWDFKFTNRNFSSFPFSQLNVLGFELKIKNKGSKTQYTSIYYSGIIDGFIVDCDVETQNENKLIRFKYYVKNIPQDKVDFKKIQHELKDNNGFFDFGWITKTYHYKNHQLQSVYELEQELIDFGKLILKVHIQPSEQAT